MALIEWKPEYNTNIPIIDRDHKVLVDIINKLADNAGTGQSVDTAILENILAELNDFVALHFRREELLMENYGYENIDSQKKSHRRFEAKIKEIHDQFAAGNTDVVGTDLIDFLRDWLINHILKSDMGYQSLFLGVMAGKPVAKKRSALASAIAYCKTVRGRLYGITAILCFALFSSAGLAIYNTNNEWESFNDADSLIDEMTHQILPLTRNSVDIRYDIVQVQQWLTDISATRGRDGLDDGFAQAEEYAKDLYQDLEESKKIAKAIGAEEIVAHLEAVKLAFGPYYEMGKTMAKAYIDGGPEKGNKLMGQFDAVAEKITEEVTGMLAAVDKTVANRREQIQALEQQVHDSVSFNRVMYLALAVTAVLLTACSFFFISGLIKAMRSVSIATTRAVFGDDDITIPHTEREDSLGDLARAVKIYHDQSKLTASVIEESAIKRQEAAEMRQQEMAERQKMMADRQKLMEEREKENIARTEQQQEFALGFEQRVKAVVDTVASAATELEATAQSMTVSAEQAGDKAQATRAGVEHASGNTSAVAGAARELLESINNISRQVSVSAQKAKEAVSEAEKTNVIVKGLAESSQKVGEVIALINDIANQTNLLALNATIEAARAGEAGKGFAVVASEVKNLASQTARATEDISNQIGEIQTSTNAAVSAIENICAKITDMDNVTSVISSEIDEQTAATNEISHNVEEASQGAEEAAENARGMSQTIEDTGRAASQVLEAAGELSRQAEMLSGEVQSFLNMIKAA